jgi:hypothetical protein
MPNWTPVRKLAFAIQRLLSSSNESVFLYNENNRQSTARGPLFEL